jgi:hypothetical protein
VLMRHCSSPSVEGVPLHARDALQGSPLHDRIALSKNTVEVVPVTCACSPASSAWVRFPDARGRPANASNHPSPVNFDAIASSSLSSCAFDSWSSLICVLLAMNAAATWFTVAVVSYAHTDLMYVMEIELVTEQREQRGHVT